MSEQNVERIRKTADAWNRADIDAWLEGTAPDVQWFTALEGLIEGVDSAYRGRDGLRKGWRHYREFWEEFDLQPQEFRDLGDRVLLLANVKARGRGSGLEVETELAMLFTFRDGLIVSSKDFLSHADAISAAHSGPSEDTT